MLVQILPIQIPNFWEVIKFAASKSDGVEEKYLTKYSNDLLHDLLAGKKHCYMVNREEKISFIAILEFRFDAVKEQKFIYFNNLYSFNPNNFLFWKKIIASLETIAKNNDCSYILGDVGNPQMWDILNQMNISCVSRKYVYRIKEA